MTVHDKREEGLEIESDVIDVRKLDSLESERNLQSHASHQPQRYKAPSIN